MTSSLDGISKKETRNLIENLPTGHTLLESTSFPRKTNEMTLNQRGIDVELMSVPSG
jgi:hypothetical protein